MKRPEGNNADEWHLFLSEYLDNRATSPSGMPFMCVQIAEALDSAYERGQRDMAKEVFALAEDTREKCFDISHDDTEGKPGAYARGRIFEAKGIAKAIGAILPPKSR